jgi:hypothetical protein
MPIFQHTISLFPEHSTLVGHIIRFVFLVTFLMTLRMAFTTFMNGIRSTEILVIAKITAIDN